MTTPPLSEMWVDYSWARPDVSPYAGVMRYLEGGGSRPDLDAAEVERIHAAGKPIGLIWQLGKADPLGGWAKGVENGERANREATLLGAPPNVAIFYAVDSDLAPAVVADYFAGIASVEGRPVGVYGSYKIVEWAASVGINWRWQTLAWSGGLLSAYANLYQRYFLSDVDQSIVFDGFPVWNPPTIEGGGMGGYTLPTAASVGYSYYPGTSKVGCDCLISWLRVFERLCLAHGYIKSSLDILQLTGDYSLSGGNHKAGGVFDIKQYDPRIVALAREMGAPGTWMRNMNFPNGSPGNTHTHGVVHCAHSWPADYQTLAQRRGFNGMGQGAAGTAYAGMWGYGGKDTHPAPKTYRTPREGIIWAEAQIAALEVMNMALTAEDKAALATIVEQGVTRAVTALMGTPAWAESMWSQHRIVKNVAAADPSTAPRVTPSTLLERSTWDTKVFRDGGSVTAIQELADAKGAALAAAGLDVAPVVNVDIDEAALAALIIPAVGTATVDPVAAAQAIVSEVVRRLAGGVPVAGATA